MHRICSSLANAGYDVTLVGRQLKSSLSLKDQPFKQKRLRCIFNKSFLFYAEYNFRLFFYLLSKKMDGICAIDLDTILPCLFISKLKRAPRIYDAHEYFTEMKEVRTRPFVQKVWKGIEKFAVPKFQYGYTVSEGISVAFKNEYNRNYGVIRNMPVLKALNTEPSEEKVLLYQGYVNEGRGFEYLIPAMKTVPYRLVICGDGNFMSQLKQLIKEYEVEDKVELKGMLPPDQLWMESQKATLGIALAEKEGLNQFMALPNKFFDYMHAGLPQLAMNYPEYQKINQQHKIAVLIDDLSMEAIAKTINETMANTSLLEELKQNCLKARDEYNWNKEEQKLLAFYKTIFLIDQNEVGQPVNIKQGKRR
jgi:glycosyltransferase involved in cell wall biosynthesis